MQTTYIGEQKVIVRGGRYFRLTEESADAATQAEWADGVLAKPAVMYPNGRNSHEAAGDVLDKAEDALIDYLLLVVSQPQWDVTYLRNDTGERRTVRVDSENREAAISAASSKMDASGWYFERAVRVS
jgi:hypothetical protein